MNRCVRGRKLFKNDSDYQAFENILIETLDRKAMRLCSYCLMPNHWHFVLWPENDGELAAFMQRLSTTHVRRWMAHRKIVGSGHLYQGRFKSLPVQHDEHFLTLARYVERNAQRAGLVDRAEQWPWSSLYLREHGDEKAKSILCDWPVDRPADWLTLVNEPHTDTELQALHTCITRDRPFGSLQWQQQTAQKLGLQSTLRSPGRPRKQK
jgi:putative transposase